MSEINLYNEDCMTAMARMPDKSFELAIVDPPYGINIGSVVGGGKPFGSKGTKNRGAELICPKIYRGFDDTRIPEKQYFQDLMRVSKNQIIWGGNYFIEHLRNTSCFIVWDKDNSGNFADCELAWTSFNTATRKYKYRWNGMLQEHMGKHKEERIHPTQKPEDLYRWLLKNYAKPGDRILETHCGSGSILIACYDMGFDIEAYEIDTTYYTAALKRLDNHQKQGQLFL